MSNTVDGWFGGGDPYEALHIARQKAAPTWASEAMIANAATFPPLGQMSFVDDTNVKFTAVLEVPHSLCKEPWEMSLWQATDGAEWTEVPLSLMSKYSLAGPLQDEPVSTTWLYFNRTLSVSKSCSFTVKFRCNPTEPWRWIRDEVGMGDGTVILRQQNPASAPVKLSHLIGELDPTWEIQTQTSQAPATRLWSLQKEIDAADGDVSCREDTIVGIPWGGFSRWMCIARLWAPWLQPQHGKTKFDLGSDGILCGFLNDAGESMVLLGISGINDIQTVFRANDGGRLVAKSSNDGAEAEKATVLVAVGDDFDKCTAAVMYHARDMAMEWKKASGELSLEVEALEEGDDANAQWRQEWYDGLGYCTWNALGQRLTDKKIYHALDKLAAANVKISNLIIDDNWQDIDYDGSGQFQFGWRDFEAEPKAFPDGLKKTVHKIREKHSGIKHVAVWHALLGYWGGISPTGNIAKKYQTTQVFRRQEMRRQLQFGGDMVVVDGPDVMRFYDDFYRFLSSCGVSGVKTDAQCMTDLWVGAPVRRNLTTKYLDAWGVQSMRHFSSRAISCMSQTPSILFHSQLPRNRPPLLVRNSDDFFPDVAASHPWHVFVNAYNSLFTRFLNVLPDWDMFQTVHDYSAFHAAARCVSGGPIYITDTPGEHDLDLIGQMTATTARGETVILRHSVVGRPTSPFAGYHDDVLLKFATFNGHADTGTPVLGVFNTSARPLVELIPLACFEGVVPATKYVVRAHTTGRITDPMVVKDPNALLTTSLGVRGYEILTAYPVTTLSGPARDGGIDVSVANLGLVGKMSGAAAIVSTFVGLADNGRVILSMNLKALGILGIFISSLPTLTIDDDFMATMGGAAIPPSTVSISRVDGRVLEIDIEKAWSELGGRPGWGNEVGIKVYFKLRK